MSSGWADSERVDAAMRVSMEFMQAAIDDGRLPLAIGLMHDLSVAMLQLAELSANTGISPAAALALGIAPHTEGQLAALIDGEHQEEDYCTVAYLGILEHIAEHIPEMEGVIKEYIDNMR